MENLNWKSIIKEFMKFYVLKRNFKCWLIALLNREPENNKEENILYIINIKNWKLIFKWNKDWKNYKIIWCNEKKVLVSIYNTYVDETEKISINAKNWKIEKELEEFE